MRRTIAGAVAGAAILMTAMAAGAESDLDTYTRASRAVANAYAESLRTELTKAIETAGPVAAIGLCNEKASVIADRLANEEPVSVRRTSLNFRNPENAPDPWERTILKSFEERRAAGEDPAKIDHAAIVMRDGKRVIQYMKAIPTGELCLSCHGGAEVSPEVAAKLEEAYPGDHARGFHVGDIRGAFTVIQPAE